MHHSHVFRNAVHINERLRKKQTKMLSTQEFLQNCLVQFQIAAHLRQQRMLATEQQNSVLDLSLPKHDSEK